MGFGLYNCKAEVQIEYFEQPAQEAKFPMSQMEFFKWLNENRVYPPAALKRGIEGGVILNLIIDEEGYIIDAKQSWDSADPDLVEEAIRLVKCLPRFEPALNSNGQPIKSRNYIRIPFRLPKEEKTN